MKNISRMIFLAVLPVLAGCLPQEQLTGRVLSLGGPVPEAAVLGMIWMEEADKAKPAAITDGLTTQERNDAYEKDAKERGLPVAYARAFTDEKGWFTLDKFHFSAGTKKIIKAMKQPRITRITLCTFQRGYLKGALTAFPKDEKELPYATMVLLRPANWKELSLDSSFSSLERPEYYNGYSKEYGATKQEKNWFLEYTHSNLYKAYTDSDIKGHKEWESYCGHDYSDVIVSTAGMQRNPAHERCGELLKRLGDIRANEEFWGNHALKPVEWIETAKETVKEAIAGLSADNGEPKEFEREILEGLGLGNDLAKTAASINWPETSKAQLEEAKLLYGKGDKVAAYKMLGQAIHARMRTVPADVQIIKIVTAIQNTLTGFCQLMNRPLTAQLPGSDKTKDTNGQSQSEKKDSPPDNSNRNINKLDEDYIELGGDKIKRSALYRGSDGAVLESREVKVMDAAGQPVEKFIERKAFGCTGADYVLRNHSILSGRGGDDVGSYETSVFELFDIKGNKLFEKELGNRNFKQAWIFKNGTSVLFTDENLDFPVHVGRYQIYDNSGNLLNEIISTAGMGDWQIAEYKITNGIDIRQFTMSPQADVGLFAAQVSGDIFKVIKLDMDGKLSEIGSSKTGYMSLIFSKGPEMFLAFTTKDIDKLAPSGRNYRSQTIYLYKNFKLMWKMSTEAESFGMLVRSFSKTGKYIILEYWKDIIMNGSMVVKYTERVKIINLADGRIVYDGDKSSEKAKEYAEESVAE